MAKDNVDERVVQLMFDSKEFDQNAKKSIQSLDDLKKALEFEGAAKSFDTIERAAKKVDLSVMENGIQRVQNHFNMFEAVASAAVERVTNKVLDAGERLIKGFTLDPLISGFQKFSDTTTASATLLAQGYSLDEVEGQLERLNWYTDETSYNFVDMVSNISKFTAAGKGLTESVTAMEGIANWAATSGQNAATASRAMYQLSQAMSAGVMRKEDWRSIQNANMDTQEFRQHAIDAALAMGTLREVSSGVYQSLVATTNAGKELFNVDQFAESLTQGMWFTSDVMMGVFKDYSSAVDQIYEYSIEKNLTASEAIEELGDQVDAFGLKTFKAAQQARTWADVVDSVKDAVSTGWSNTYKAIFGNAEEATELFTDMANALYEVFAEQGNARNELLRGWREHGGRETLLEGFKELWKNIDGILKSISTAWEKIFGKTFEEQVQDLVNFTEGFRQFAESITFTDGTFRDFVRILESGFRIMKTFGRVFNTVLRSMEPVARILNRIGGVVLHLVANFAELLSINIDKFFNDQKLEVFYNALNMIASVIELIGTIGVGVLFDTINTVSDLISGFLATFNATTGGIDGLILALIETVKSLWNAFMSGESVGNIVADSILTALRTVVGGVMLIAEQIYNIFTGKKVDTEGFSGLDNWLQKISDILDRANLEEKFQSVAHAAQILVDMVRQLFADLTNADSNLRKTIAVFGEEMRYFWDWFKRIIGEMSAEDVAKIGMMVVIMQLITGMTNLNKATTKLVSSLTGISNTIGTFTKSLLLGEDINFVDKLSTIFNKTKIMQIGIAAVMLAAAFNEFNNLDYQRTVQSLIVLGVAMGLMLVAFKKWDEINTLAMKHAAKYKKDSNVGKFILEISGSVLLISVALNNLSKILAQKEGVAQVIGSMTLLGIAVVGIYELVKKMQTLKMKEVSGAATSMIALATALTMMTIPILTMGAIDLDHLAKGVVALSGTILALGYAMKAMEKVKWQTVLSAGVAFSSIALSLVTLTAAVIILGQAPWGNIGKMSVILVELTAAIAALGWVSTSIKPDRMNAISKSLIAFSAALGIMAASTLLLNNADLWKLAGALAALLIPFAAIIGLIVYFQGPLLAAKPIIEAVSNALLKFAGSVAIVAAAAALISVTSLLIQGAILALGVVVQQFGEDWDSFVKTAFAGFAVVLDEFLNLLIQFTPKIAATVVEIIVAIRLAIATQKAIIAKEVWAIVLEILVLIGTAGDPLADAILKIIDVLNRRLPEIFDALGEFIHTLFVGIGVIIHDALTGLGDMIYAIVTGDFPSRVGEPLEGFTEEEVKKRVSRGAIFGLKRGLEEGARENDLDSITYSLGYRIGKTLDSGFCRAMDINSPSGVMIYRMMQVGLGVASGTTQHLIPAASTAGKALGETLDKESKDSIIENADKVIDGAKAVGVASGTEMAKSAVNSAKNTLNNTIGSVWDEVASYMTLPDLSDYGLFNFGKETKKYGGGGDNSLANQMLKDQEAANNKVKEAQEPKWFDTGYDLGESLGKGLSSGSKSGATKEKEKTAEEIVKENLDAISKAYSRAVDAIDLKNARAELDDKFWEATHKEGATDEEKKAYEQEKRLHDIEVVDRKMQMQILNMQAAEAKYRDTLNEMGSSAKETAEAYNNMLSQRLEMITLNNERNELLTQENEVNKEGFVEAARQITEYQDAVKAGLITQEQALQAAKNRMAQFNEQAETKIEDTNVQINQLAKLLDEVAESGQGLTSDVWNKFMSSAILGALDGMEENSDKIAWSMTSYYADAVEKVLADNTLGETSQGLGENIDKGTINGMESLRKEVVAKGIEVSSDTLEGMANALEVNSPSKATIRMGEWIDEGLAQGLLNDGKVQAIMNAADSIARKLIARLKAKLGVHSPSTISDEIGGYFDDGLVNGVYRKVYAVRDAGNYLADSLTNATRSSLDQNGNLPNGYMKDLFGLTDDDLHLQVVVDIDNSRALDSMSQLEAYTSGALSGTVNANTDRRYIRQDRSSDAVFQARALANAYSALNETLEYMRQSKEQAAPKTETLSEPTNVTFNQYNTSPKPISTLDTYRNTKKQLSTFERKFSKK